LYRKYRGDPNNWMGILGLGGRMRPVKFYYDPPRYHGKEIFDKIGYNMACIGDVSEILETFSGLSY